MRESKLWQASPPLTVVGIGMAVVAVLSLVGVAVDPRVITGMPAWIKPFKFAISTSIYALTLAWVFTHVMERERLRRVVGWTTALVFVLEVAVIDVQAARGVTSHFNTSTPFDRTVFAAMGIAILIQTLSAVAVVIALWRHPFTDRALGAALRLGMTLTVAGAFVGPLMTRPTPAQLEAVRATGQLNVVGAHTVGAPDGGPGMPVTGWSREHGDLRVPHFIGLHAIQVLAIVVLLLGRTRFSAPARLRAVQLAAAGYTLLFLSLLLGALRGQSAVSFL